MKWNVCNFAKDVPVTYANFIVTIIVVTKKKIGDNTSLPTFVLLSLADKKIKRTEANSNRHSQNSIFSYFFANATFIPLSLINISSSLILSKDLLAAPPPLVLRPENETRTQLSCLWIYSQTNPLTSDAQNLWVLKFLPNKSILLTSNGIWMLIHFQLLFVFSEILNSVT